MHTYFTDHYVAHAFDGGICGHGGTCANGECCECYGTHGLSYYYSTATAYGSWTYSEAQLAELAEFSLTKQAEDQMVIRELPGTDNYILGPFYFNTSKHVSASNYTVTIYKKEGGKISASNYTVCDANGTAITLAGSRKSSFLH